MQPGWIPSRVPPPTNTGGPKNFRERQWIIITRNTDSDKDCFLVARLAMRPVVQMRVIAVYGNGQSNNTWVTVKRERTHTRMYQSEHLIAHRRYWSSVRKYWLRISIKACSQHTNWYEVELNRTEHQLFTNSSVKSRNGINVSTTADWAQTVYIEWQWRNFVPYPRQLIFAAIL